MTVCDQMNEFICGNSAKRSNGDSGDLLMGDMGWKLGGRTMSVRFQFKRNDRVSIEMCNFCPPCGYDVIDGCSLNNDLV